MTTRTRIALRTSAPLLLALSLLAAARPADARESATSAAAVEFERDWIVTPRAGRELIQGGALVIDARGADLKKKAPLAGAAAAEWQDLSEPALPTKGRLLSDARELDRRLQALGLTPERPVVVVADPVNGWGEDGRIAWALRTFGHGKVVIVDGGLPALQKDGPLAIAPPVVPGTFRARFDARWHVTKEELKAHLGKGELALLDVREPREYAGKTPYGESRGGHIPGAKGLWYKDLIGPDGKLLPRADIEKALASRGITKTSNVVAYCTGGIRSGWFTTVLNDLGYKARNYPGSGWEWASSPAGEYPLVKD